MTDADADRTPPLPPLPPQPSGTPWPASGTPWPASGTPAATQARRRPPDGPPSDWPEGGVPSSIAASVDALVEQAFDPSGSLAPTHAVVIVHRGRIVVERYDGQLDHLDRPPETIGPATSLLSWSMAKSVLHAAVGILVDEGALTLDRPAPVPEWQDRRDPRRHITLDYLLAMCDGLDFTENYTGAGRSDVVEMLFGRGRDDVAHFAADRPLAAVPGERFNYSSGTSNVLSGIVARLVGPGDAYERFLAERIFDPIGITTARPGMDASGTWVASSYLHATARDFARFGLLYLRGGVWEGRRVLSADWVDTARRARSTDPTDGQVHSMHWWVVPDGAGTFAALGFEGQSISLCPAADLCVIRLGKTASDHYPALRRWRADLVATFASGHPPS